MRAARAIARGLVDAVLEGDIEPCRNERCQIEELHPHHDDVPTVGRPTESVLPPNLFALVDEAISKEHP